MAFLWKLHRNPNDLAVLKILPRINSESACCRPQECQEGQVRVQIRNTSTDEGLSPQDQRRYECYRQAYLKAHLIPNPERERERERERESEPRAREIEREKEREREREREREKKKERERERERERQREKENNHDC